MIPLKDVTCFDCIHFRVPEFWAEEPGDGRWRFRRQGEMPNTATGFLTVVYQAYDVDGEATPGQPGMSHHSADGELNGRPMRSYRWDRFAFEGRFFTAAIFSYMVPLARVDSPDIVAIKDALDREIRAALFMPPLA
jgi:hypothetical protein